MSNDAKVISCQKFTDQDGCYAIIRPDTGIDIAVTTNAMLEPDSSVSIKNVKAIDSAVSVDGRAGFALTLQNTNKQDIYATTVSILGPTSKIYFERLAQPLSTERKF